MGWQSAYLSHGEAVSVLVNVSACVQRIHVAVLCHILITEVTSYWVLLIQNGSRREKGMGSSALII
jgi:hypothetical protein